MKCKVSEFCPACQQEVLIPKGEPSNCPNCEMLILPCSMCEEDYSEGCTSAIWCNWDDATGCIKFAFAK